MHIDPVPPQQHCFVLLHLLHCGNCLWEVLMQFSSHVHLVWSSMLINLNNYFDYCEPPLVLKYALHLHSWLDLSLSRQDTLFVLYFYSLFPGFCLSRQPLVDTVSTPSLVLRGLYCAISRILILNLELEILGKHEKRTPLTKSSYDGRRSSKTGVPLFRDLFVGVTM